MVVAQLLSENLQEDFNKTFPQIVKALQQLGENTFQKGMKSEINWMKTVFQHNVEHLDNKLRGCIVPALYKSLQPSHVENGSPKNQLQLSYYLGWIVEIYHGALLITSSMLNERKFVSGCRLAWHQVDTVGMNGINDGFMLHIMAAHNIFQIYFLDHPARFQLQDICREAHQRAVLGKVLDEKLKRHENLFESYTLERFRQVVQWKLSYSSFYLPAAFAFILAENWDNPELIKTLKQLMFEIGYYFKIGKDYAEVFEAELATDKLEKLSWFFVKFLEITQTNSKDVADRQVDKLNGYMESKLVKNVRKMYQKIGLDMEYEKERELSRRKIREKIDSLGKILKNPDKLEVFENIVKLA